MLMGRVGHREQMFLAMLIANPLHAQNLPEAGSLQQQLNPPRTTVLPDPAPPMQAVPAQEAPDNRSASTLVTSFSIRGNTLLSDAQLQAVLAPFYAKRLLTFSDLQAAASAITAAYREAGWIVATLVPAQEVVAGVVKLVVVEARFGGVIFEGAAPTASRLQLDRYFDSQQAAAGVLSAPGLDRALLLLGDLPGVGAAGALREGQREGEVDLSVRLAEQGRSSGDVRVDNAGERSTGSERLFANLKQAGLGGIGDLLDVSAMASNGSTFARAGYSLPLGYDGLRVGLSTSAFEYRLITADFASLDAKGSASTAALEASYPLVRSGHRNLYLFGDLGRKNFDNQSNGATQSYYQSQAFSLGLSGNSLDSLGAGGVSTVSLSVTSGQLNLDQSPNQASDAATTQTAGNFGKLRYSAERLQSVSGTLSLFGSITGQIANKNLDSSEKFYLGGAEGVRAYPANEGAGSEGHLLKLEARWRPSVAWGITAFYDVGDVTINRNNQFAGAGSLNHYSLRGAGLSASWWLANRLGLQATWARRIGDNPNPGTGGNDKDGTLVMDRVWLLAQLPF